MESKRSCHKKCQLPASPSSVLEELDKQLEPFLTHVYVKRKQSAAFENLKRQTDKKTVLVQVDFSENASLNAQNEIQSAHWSHSQVTLFTCFCWIDNIPQLHESLVIISDELRHEKHGVNKYMMKIFSYLLDKYPMIETIHVFSDGASSQFKQRFLFSNLSRWEANFGVDIRWHFFATSHGKGAVDGLGGTIKRAVRAGRVFPKDAADFFTARLIAIRLSLFFHHK